MKPKIALLSLVFVSSLIFSACGTKTAQTSPDAQQSQRPNPSGVPGQQMAPKMDFAVAAEKLGVSEQALKEAMGINETAAAATEPDHRPDLETVAEKLNVTIEKLQSALGMDKLGPGPSGSPENPPQNQ